MPSRIFGGVNKNNNYGLRKGRRKKERKKEKGLRKKKVQVEQLVLPIRGPSLA